jgi:predicted nucleotidyltransferase
MMNAPSNAVLDALFPKARQRLLAILFQQPERSFYANELIRLAQSGIGATQRELQSLAAAGLITAEMRGNQKHYQANAASPVFAELRGLMVKTLGIPEHLTQALAALSESIRWAVLYGSAARSELHAGSDIDLMVIADNLSLEALYAALADAETALGRRINPTLYTRQEFDDRRAAGNAFLTKVLAGDTITLLGGRDAET